MVEGEIGQMDWTVELNVLEGVEEEVFEEDTQAMAELDGEVFVNVMWVK